MRPNGLHDPWEIETHQNERRSYDSQQDAKRRRETNKNGNIILYDGWQRHMMRPVHTEWWWIFSILKNYCMSSCVWGSGFIAIVFVYQQLFPWLHCSQTPTLVGVRILGSHLPRVTLFIASLYTIYLHYRMETPLTLIFTSLVRIFVYTMSRTGMPTSALKLRIILMQNYDNPISSLINLHEKQTSWL